MQNSLKASKCAACGTVTRVTNKLCDKCGDPEKIIFVCKNCFNRFEVWHHADLVGFEILLKRPLFPGTTVATNQCGECFNPDLDLCIEMYYIKESENVLLQ